MQQPIVLDMGKQKRKRIRQLKRGEGRMMEDVAEAVQHVAAGLGPEAEGKELLPVILIYRQKSRGAKGLFPIKL